METNEGKTNHLLKKCTVVAPQSVYKICVSMDYYFIKSEMTNTQMVRIFQYIV